MSGEFRGNFWGWQLHELHGNYSGNSRPRKRAAPRVSAGSCRQLCAATLYSRVAQLRDPPPFTGGVALHSLVAGTTTLTHHRPQRWADVSCVRGSCLHSAGAGQSNVSRVEAWRRRLAATGQSIHIRRNTMSLRSFAAVPVAACMSPGESVPQAASASCLSAAASLMDTRSAGATTSSSCPSRFKTCRRAYRSSNGGSPATEVRMSTSGRLGSPTVNLKFGCCSRSKGGRLCTRCRNLSIAWAFARSRATQRSKFHVGRSMP